MADALFCAELQRDQPALAKAHCATKLMLLKTPVDATFEVLKQTFLKSPDTKTKIGLTCKGHEKTAEWGHPPCVARMADALFCAQLTKDHPDLAKAHCATKMLLLQKPPVDAAFEALKQTFLNSADTKTKIGLTCKGHEKTAEWGHPLLRSTYGGCSLLRAADKRPPRPCKG